MKMEKTPRYTQRERNMVLGFAAQYKDVIENKRTDAESNRKKDEVWRQIAKEFNCRVYHQRSSKQLRQLYKNMKLLLKKDLCGDGKSNRSFMDILNALAQQDSVAQYISEQMSPSGYSSSRQQKYDDDFDDSKLPSVGYDGMDNDVIVIKSEDISDNEQASQNGVEDMDDDDDDDCLSTKDIPEVCLEEEDDEIFATDLRRNSNPNPQLQAGGSLQSPQQQQLSSSSQPEITIQNVGGIRVGSIGNIASLTNPKSLLNGINNNNSSSSNNNNNNNNNNSSSNNNSALSINLPTSNSRSQISAEQQQQRDQQQQLLFSGLGLSAVNTDQSQQQQLPTLQHASQRPTSNNHNNNNNNHHHHHNNSNAINSNGLLTTINSNYQSNKMGGGSSSSTHNNNNSPYGLLNRNSSGNSSSNNNRNNDYLLSLAIEERKRKIELLNAQIDYWKTLTKKLDANSGHNPTPSCLCHFPAKVNGLQSQQSSS